MRILRDLADIQTLDSGEIRRLIEARIADLTESGEYRLEELVYFVVVEPGDTTAALEAHLGRTVLITNATGVYPSWEVLEEHPSCYEMVIVLNDEGAGVEVFIPKEGTDDNLLRMCRRYAVPAREPTKP